VASRICVLLPSCGVFYGLLSKMFCFLERVVVWCCRCFSLSGPGVGVSYLILLDSDEAHWSLLEKYEIGVS